ncbi:MAG: hypothetical protein Q8L26_01720 [Candidatus Omnitrophota bacterium]|nr:hypothetical protein [Candidatus Omnitrophota bacterium]
MSRKKHKAPPFVMVRRDLLKDPEWRKLSSSAKVLYIYLRAKFNHKTLSEVTLAYSEMKGVMSSKTMSRAFKELMDGKWIEKVKYGGLFGGVSSYKFTGQYKDFCYMGFKV